LLQLVNSTVEDVSIKEDIGYETVMGIINQYIATEADWSEFQTLEVLGLDEIALKKGHKNFATIATARIRDQIMVLGVLNGRTKGTVVEFLTGIPQKLRDSIHSVCCDMYDGYINAAKEVLGADVKIVIDRFHVAKGYRKGVDNLRKQELKRLNKELPEEDYKQFKGAMWALRKDKEKLSQQEQHVITSLFSHSPLLKLAYGFRNELTSIFEKNLTKIKAMKKISNWKKRVKESRLTCFNNFLSTLDNRMEEITNYFENRLNSGFVEGLNNKIKVIKRRCYGILNVNHLFQRICLDLNGYARFA
jgi:transposase